VLATGVLLLAVVAGVGALVGVGPSARPAAVATSAGSAIVASGSERGTLRRLDSAGTTLRVLSSSTTTRIVNAYLPPLQATGVFLLLDLAATNTSDDPASLASGELGLWLGGVRYPVDSAALAALELAGHRTLAGAELAPGAATSGWLVFDVPAQAAGDTPQVCLAPAGSAPSGGGTCP
jgi:Domain of unknown function (DUF4352)